jgi:acetyl esterase
MPDLCPAHPAQAVLPAGAGSAPTLTPQQGRVHAGARYLERGQPVQVLARWRPRAGGPRNVLVRRGGGSQVVRPFRGLRKLKEDIDAS